MYYEKGRRTALVRKKRMDKRIFRDREKKVSRQNTVVCKYYLEGKCNKVLLFVLLNALLYRKDNQERHLISEMYLCFLKSISFQGNDCQYSHDASHPKKRHLEQCNYYLKGNCNRGDDCLFLHHEFPCRFYHMGKECYQGPNCKFSHNKLSEELQHIVHMVSHRDV